MRLAIAIVIGLFLSSTVLAGRCPRPCKKALGSQLKSCKAACPKRKAGKDCRSACAAKHTAATTTCKSSVAPTPPLCGSTPVITPTTGASTSTNPTSTSTVAATTSTSTSTTLCQPTSCAGAGIQCGGHDDGCGGPLDCGGCPAENPVCIDSQCHPACTGAPDGTSCDTDDNLCSIEQCSGGTCQPYAFVFCQFPQPCYSAVACNPLTGTCQSSSYVGDGGVCFSSFFPIGICAGGACQVGKECYIDATAYAAGDRDPGNACKACQPGYSRGEFTAVTNGIACEGGLCKDGACNADVCWIDGALRAAGATNPSDPCQSCQPNASRTQWLPASGATCNGGVCVSGSCNASYCSIGGAVHPNGTVNPGNWCQKCDVSTSRTSWTTLPNFSFCGQGCLSGYCDATFGGCAITGSSACGSTDCGTGYCDAASGQCKFTPKNVGGACSQPTTNGCTSTTGTCDAAGNCVRPGLTGNTCNPGPQPNMCLLETGKCANGVCVPDTLAHMAPCQPPGGDVCRQYFCDLYDGRGVVCNPLGVAVQCNPVPAGCAAGVCQSQTGTCTYGPYPNGTLSCSSDANCCPGQVCASPTTCGQFCLGKQCYYPGTN